jgi:hypothetical protein
LQQPWPESEAFRFRHLNGNGGKGGNGDALRQFLGNGDSLR